MDIVENLQKYLPSSEKYMSSYGKKHLLNQDFTNLQSTLGSGSFTELDTAIKKFKYVFLKFLIKKTWEKEVFDSVFFKNYENLCDKQNRMIDFTVIAHAFTLQILDEKKLLNGKICTIGDGKANFITGCLFSKNNITLYSVNLPQALIQDYLIIKKFNILNDENIKVVNSEEDLNSKNIKLFLIPAEKKSLLKNQNINLFSNIVCFQEIPKTETREYFEIIKNNKGYLYCCNREEKKLYDGEIIKYYDYPWGDCRKIFEEECLLYRKYYSLRPPFIHKIKDKIIHSLTKFN